MLGSVNTPGVGKNELDAVKKTAEGAAQAAAAAQKTADEAKEEAEKGGGGGVPIDDDSTVAFSFGCDARGVYIVTPDETAQGGAD